MTSYAGPTRRPRLSVRARAALAAVLALAPLATAAAVAGVLVQRHELSQATSLVAEEQARSTARSLRGGDRSSVAGTLGGEETLVQVVGADGVVRESSPLLRGSGPLVGPPGGAVASRTQRADLVPGEGDTYAVVALGVVGTDSYVVAARSLESAQAATASTTRLLLVGVPALVLLVGLLSWFLAGRALAPVEQLRRRASEITAAGTGVRLPQIGTGDEIARLAETLNEMLGRLDASARAQRQFVADASHELRSPVASIRAVMEVSRATCSDPDEVRADVLAETERLTRLVDGLLALARRDATAVAPGSSGARDAEPVDLTALVEDAAARPRRVPVTTRVAAGCTVAGDARALGTVLTNLLDNAERHAAGRIHVELRGGPTTPAVVLSVADDGAGVPVAERERVFDRFVRLDEARDRDSGGAGLGLAIARATVEDHGGTLTCAAPQEPSASGVVFLVALPSGARALAGARERGSPTSGL